MEHYDLLIVGAGLSGAVIAEHAVRAGQRVLVIDKRDHIAGNVYDEIDAETGIRVSRYGAHLFHTNDVEVWDYVNSFGKFKRWDHTVVADVSGILVPVPVNITTVNALFDLSIQNEDEMTAWLQKERVLYESGARNSEEVALSRVGPRLYDMLFKHYTVKQWAKGAADLDASVLERIPVRTNFDNRYFGDRYQGLPVDGYTALVDKMLAGATVRLNCDWSKLVEDGGCSWTNMVFTGPIDGYFKGSGLPRLEYRSINFEWSRVKTDGFIQPNSVVNYPGSDSAFTRVVEYKHFLNQRSAWTIVAKETTCDVGEPYYPVPNQANRDLYAKYVELAAGSGVHFVGRLASYKYFNMDQAIRNAMDYFKAHLSG
jgi:UDP-galactopyranose mutase